MKQYLKISTILGAMMVASCGAPNSGGTDMVKLDSVNIKRVSVADIFKYTDRETGCEYLMMVADGRGSMTARIDSDGKPICSRTPSAPSNAPTTGS